MILFLDFDGVLHPESVYLTGSGPKLGGDGELFMWAPILEQALMPYPQVRLVLSTSWVRHLGFSRAKKRLSPALQCRVVGSTWHSSMLKAWVDQVWWDQSSRHGQIIRYVARSGAQSWLALDDDDLGWPVTDSHRLIRVDGSTGISDERVIDDLKLKLKAMSIPDA